MALDQVLSGRFPPNWFFFFFFIFSLMSSLNDLHFACVFWKPTRHTSLHICSCSQQLLGFFLFNYPHDSDDVDLITIYLTVPEFCEVLRSFCFRIFSFVVLYQLLLSVDAMFPC